MLGAAIMHMLLESFLDSCIEHSRWNGSEKLAMPCRIGVLVPTIKDVYRHAQTQSHIQCQKVQMGSLLMGS